jgi:hypothetical protein
MYRQSIARLIYFDRVFQCVRGVDERCQARRRPLSIAASTAQVRKAPISTCRALTRTSGIACGCRMLR